MTEMPQILLKNILTEGFSKYKLIDGRKIDYGFNRTKQKYPGFGAGLLLAARGMFV